MYLEEQLLLEYFLTEEKQVFQEREREESLKTLLLYVYW